MARADKFTLERKKAELYADIPTNFDVNPITGLLTRVINEDAVGQSLRHLILTALGERFYDTNKGSKVPTSLFEPTDLANLEVIRIQVREACNYEPRAVIHDIRITDNIDRNGYDLAIVYSVLNIPDQRFSLAVNVVRAR